VRIEDRARGVDLDLVVVLVVAGSPGWMSTSTADDFSQMCGSLSVGLNGVVGSLSSTVMPT